MMVEMHGIASAVSTAEEARVHRLPNLIIDQYVTRLKAWQFGKYRLPYVHLTMGTMSQVTSYELGARNRVLVADCMIDLTVR
jgi:hypothetical protein